MSKINFNTKLAIPAAFLLSGVYWIYLALTARMLVIFDALAYESSAKIIYQSGWIEFLKAGPHREPLYPWFVSLSMHLTGFLALPYQSVLVWMQITVLFLVQLLVLHLCQKLSFRPILTFFILLYTGFSPALVNSALSPMSEILACLLITALLIFLVKSWRAVLSSQPALHWAALTAITGSLITLVKGIFEYVMPFLLLPFIYLAFTALRDRRKNIFTNTVVYFFCVLLIFYFPIIAYKSLNKKFNGKYVITERGDRLLYGNAARRTEKADTKKVLAALARIPGEGIARSFLNKEDYEYWAYQTTENIGVVKERELLGEGMPREKIESKLISLAAQKIFENPLQYLFFAAVEGTKVFFWESTQAGFVSYPAWLKRTFEFTPFKNGLRFLISGLTLISFFYLFFAVWRRKGTLRDVSSPDSETAQICFFILFLLVSYIGFYSLVSILIRYSIPVAALLLLSAGVFLNNTLLKGIRHGTR